MCIWCKTGEIPQYISHISQFLSLVQIQSDTTHIRLLLFSQISSIKVLYRLTSNTNGVTREL